MSHSTCPECHGEQYVRYGFLWLRRRVCPKCGGFGKTPDTDRPFNADWTMLHPHGGAR